MSKTLKTSKLYTDGIDGADGNSSDQPLLDAFTQSNPALDVLDGTMPVYGSTGGGSMTSGTSGAGAGAGSGTSTGSGTAANPWNETLQVGTPGHGLCFNNAFNADWSRDLDNCVVAAEKTLSTLFTNTVTVNVSFAVGYSAPTTSAPNPLGAWNSWSGFGYSYGWLHGVLPSSDSLPTNDPSPGGPEWGLPAAYARMLGDSKAIPNQPTLFAGQQLYLDDGVGLNTYYKWTYGQDVINALIHELSEGILGRVGGLGDATGQWGPMDLFRYNAAGAHDYADGADGQTTYWSSDGVVPSEGSPARMAFNNEYALNGNTPQQVNTGDTADWAAGQQGVFGDGGAGETFTLTQTELDVIHALGWNEALPQEIFGLVSSADWQTPTAWSDGFMPITVQDAFIGSILNSYKATSNADVTVNSIGTSGEGTLIIGSNSTFTATNGTVLNPFNTYALASGNFGTIDVDVGSTLQMGNTFLNTGSLTLGTNGKNDGDIATLDIIGTLKLTGGGKGSLYLGQQISGTTNYTAGLIESAGGWFTSTLVNVDNTITGGGEIELPSFENQSSGVVDASQPGHSLWIYADSILNAGKLKAEASSTLHLGEQYYTVRLNNNNGAIELYGGNLEISGNLAVSGGSITFYAPNSTIGSDGQLPTTFTNASAIGAFNSGEIGDSNLSFVNAGSVLAVGAGTTLKLYTGSNQINNLTGTLKAMWGGTLVISSDVETGQLPGSSAPGGIVEAGPQGAVSIGAVTIMNYSGGGLQIDNGGKLTMIGTSLSGFPITLGDGGTLALWNTGSLIGATGNNAEVDLWGGAQVAVTGDNDTVDFSTLGSGGSAWLTLPTSAGNVANLWFTGSKGDTINTLSTVNGVTVDAYNNTVNLNTASATINGGIHYVNFKSGSDSVTLVNTGDYTDNVVATKGTISLNNAQAAIVGDTDVVNFSSGSNVANLWDTFNAWDAVNGSNGTINLYNSRAIVDSSNGSSTPGGNNTIYFGTSGDEVRLYNNSILDTVTGSPGTVDLYSANVEITGSSNVVNLNSGPNTVTLSGGPSNTVNLSNNGGNSETINVTGYVYQTVNLNNASATINGGIQNVNLTGSGDVANLSNTGPYTDNVVDTDKVFGSNETVSLSNAQAAIVGGPYTVNFSSGSNVANLWDSFSASDTVNSLNGSNGTVNMYNSSATVTGGNGNTVNFWTSGEHADITGNNDLVGFFGGIGTDTASVVGTGEDFKFNPTWGKAYIAGFNGSDHINLSASDFGGNWAGVQSHMVQVGTNTTVITLDQNNSITLTGVAMNTLQPLQFNFA
jgi:hypothetical protein